MRPPGRPAPAESPKECSDVDDPGKNDRSLAAGEAAVSPAQGVPRPGECLRPGRLPQGGSRLRKILGQFRKRARMVLSVAQGSRLEAPESQVVPGGQAERVRQLRRPARERIAAEQGGARLGGGARRPAHDHLSRASPRGVQIRKCPQDTRGQERRSRHPLSSDDSGAARGDARVRSHRRDPFGRVRGILGGIAHGSHQRPASQDSRHRRRRMAPREHRAL